MEETNGREDLHVNVVWQSSFHPAGSLKVTSSGKSTPRGSPSFRKLRTPRRDFKGNWGRFLWMAGNRLVFLLVLITLWAYGGFYVQSKWAHNEHSKPEFLGSKSQVGSVQKVMDVSTTVDTFVDNPTNSSRLGSVILKENEEMAYKNFDVNLVMKGKPGISRQNATSRSKHRRLEHRLRNNSNVPAKAVSEDNTGANVDEGIARRNTSYGLLVGPFGKTEDSVLGWRADRRKGTCNKKGEFGRLVLSKRFVLIFHELSMTGAPLSMMELATEILSCGGSVSVVVLSRKGGLMGELIRRGIKVLKDKGKLSYKIARRADLIIAGSAVCSSWIEQYISSVTAGSNQILWWIMENRREYFDRSKHLLSQVKMLMFLSDLQSTQWLTWCEEEHIQLKTKPTTVSLSVNDELAFVAGFPCSFNTPSLTVEKMEEKRKLLRLAVRKELGLADNDMLVISLSSINPGKGQFLLLESVLLVAERKPPLIDLNINSSMQDRNLSSVSMQDENQHQGTLPGNLTHENLEDVLQTNSNISYTVKKRRKKHSRLPKILSMNDSSETIQHLDALKVLIGSVGSKSNKVLYVKGLLKFLSRHSNLSKLLLWTPATTRVSSLYAAADAYVINAQGIGETFGRVTVEAMAFGLPVLGTDAGGTREIVEDKVTGLLHPIGREGIGALAQNLQFLLSNPTAREQLGKNGRLKVEKMYLKRHMYEKMAEVFIQCIKAE